MATQRKIHHVLDSVGEDQTFRYLPRLKAPLDLSRPVLVTEKVDGSTMQFKDGEPWKRYDRFSKGDPRKREVPEEERYELRKCSSDNPAEKWYLASYETHRLQFEEFGRRFPGHWIYFEALGARIGARYKGLQSTVRVFDAAGPTDGFLPFDVAHEMARMVGLPVVASRINVFGSLNDLLADLKMARSSDQGFPEHALEGWVLRQMVGDQEVVAKIRVKDLDKLTF